MPERTSAIPAWAWIVGAVLVFVGIFAGYRMVQTQQRLAAAQSELESATRAAEKANAERKELQIKLDEATSEVRSAQSRLVKTQPLLEAAQSALESAKQAAEKANAQRAEIQIKLDEAAAETKSVQSRLAETQSRLEAAQSELESAKQAAEQAKAQVAELEQKAASLKSELQKADGQRIELQSEIERLKSEHEQAPRSEVREGRSVIQGHTEGLAPVDHLPATLTYMGGQLKGETTRTSYVSPATPPPDYPQSDHWQRRTRGAA